MKMKKGIIMILTALAPCIASAQTANNFTITGHIGNLNAPAKAYLDYMDNMDNGANHTDSAVLVNGTFKFTGHNSGYATARMALSHDGSGKDRAIYMPTSDVIYIYFGKENVVIASKDSLANAVFTGSKVYDEFQAYVKTTGGTVMQFAKEANAEISSSPELQNDQEFVKEVGERYHKKMDEHFAKQIQFAKDHPDSYFGLVGLSEGIGNKFDPKIVKPIFNALKKEYQLTDAGKELKQRIEAMENIVIGAQAPAFTQNDVNGKPVSLASYKGKYVLVDFWASWCSPCRAENPNLVDQYKIYKAKGFEILSVSLDSDHGKWVNAIAADNLTWTHVSDLKGWNNAVGHLYGVRAVPQNFLLDKDGKVIGVNLIGEELNKKLAETFKN
ncbi:AhpC/TSA family protein [Mucilaginibacter ginsenosidivorax]|uniref:AhpC/TSA family protein n=2 Tax=Mucilaginibacter ginsenosidivorax TaxID=862126 RepID=A0A5B8W953_9SPHI|nr:AhpC/TSA family protein [Mucilaginibacter ginsenosidivorax]